MAPPEPQNPAFPQEMPECGNPFFPCINTDKELKIVADIQLGNDKHPICRYCWAKIAESDEYQWSTPKLTETAAQPLEADWATPQEQTDT